MKRLISLLILTAAAGCGGEDFSQPVTGMAERFAKAANDPPANPAVPKAIPDGGAAKPSGTAPDESPPSGTAVAATSQSDSALSDDAAKPEIASQADGMPAVAVTTNDIPQATSATAPAESPVPTDPLIPQQNAQTAAVAPGSDREPGDAQVPATAPAGSGTNEVMTASGKSSSEIRRREKENSRNTVSENAGGLLASLKGSSKPPGVPGQVVANPAEGLVAQLTRFGRTALSAPDWLRLVTRLTHRFHVAATPDGRRIVATSGERSAGIVSIQPDQSPIPFQGRPGLSESGAADSAMLVISSLPGLVSSVEMTSDGRLALFGTNDGRLLVRSAADSADWDLYARDQFQFQDEFRRTARLSDAAILAVRTLPNDRILIVDGTGACTIRPLRDVIHDVVPIQQMTAELIASPEAEVVTAAPAPASQVSGLEILSLNVSEDGRFTAVVTSSESVTILHAETGEQVDELNASHFGDTQPVCVAFLPNRQELLAGLADGRIVRRAFGKDTSPVSGTDDQGNPVDYDPVFIPDLRDQPDSITAMAVVPGTSLVYAGSVTGQVSRIDLVQRRVERTERLHDGAVLEFRIPGSGVLSIADDRTAVLFDVLSAAAPPLTNDQRRFELPKNWLPEASPGSGGDGGTTRQNAPVPVDQSLVGIRPADMTLALLSHQLRTVGTAEDREQLRTRILDHLGMPAGPPLETSEKKYGSAPTMLQQITTQFQFGNGNWSPVCLSISADAKVAAATHPSRPGVEVHDLPTGIVLRRWTQLPTTQSLQLADEFGILLPNAPAAGRMTLMDGAFRTTPGQRCFASAMAPDQQSSVMGHLGLPGIAAPALTRFDHRQQTALNGHELFEFMVTALAYTPDGQSLFASVRSQDQTSLHELDPTTLELRQKLSVESLSGGPPADWNDALSGSCGAVLLHVAESGRALLTFGTYQDGSQLRLWKKSGGRWPQEAVQVFREPEMLPDPRFGQPLAFVSHQLSKIAIVTTSGLSILNLKKQEVEYQQAIPDVVGRRPVVCFSRDAKWLLAGDGDGTIWAASLMNPTRKPLSFQAHSGPIAGMTFSDDGRILLTAGEDNRIRSWSVSSFLGL